MRRIRYQNSGIALFQAGRKLLDCLRLNPCSLLAQKSILNWPERALNNPALDVCFVLVMFPASLAFTSSDPVLCSRLCRRLFPCTCFLVSPQFFQEAISKSGRSPPDSHVPPFATYELGVLYARDPAVRTLCRAGNPISSSMLEIFARALGPS